MNKNRSKALHWQPSKSASPSQQAACACASRACCGGAESEMQMASCATTHNTLQTSLRLRLIRLRMQQRNKRLCSARQGAPAMRDATQLAR
ncbi:hypothetical protein ADT25_16120 [Xanthomonas oryzae]|uniref:Uncharacterized protein n=1 Tax=Xanthomonas oryzae TaxID=347 RepID=A0AAP0ZJ98_9XANT|nr:hypothetical protein ADT25_16120 [Xanthomonas oryzae]